MAYRLEQVSDFHRFVAQHGVLCVVLEVEAHDNAASVLQQVPVGSLDLRLIRKRSRLKACVRMRMSDNLRHN